MEPATIPDSKPSVPQTPAPIIDVAPPPKTSEPQLAIAPPEEPRVSTPLKNEATSTTPADKKPSPAPAKSATYSSGPVIPIIIAVIVCIALSALAYYAYTKKG